MADERGMMKWANVVVKDTDRYGVRFTDIKMAYEHIKKISQLTIQNTHQCKVISV